MLSFFLHNRLSEALFAPTILAKRCRPYSSQMLSLYNSLFTPADVIDTAADVEEPVTEEAVADRIRLTCTTSDAITAAFRRVLEEADSDRAALDEPPAEDDDGAPDSVPPCPQSWPYTPSAETDLFHSVHLDFLQEPGSGASYCTPAELAPFRTLGDDLESFYWILLWCVLRQMQPSFDNPNLDVRTASGRLFSTSKPWLARCTKSFWLEAQLGVGVPGDAPLTSVVEEFTEVCSAAVTRRGERVPLDHESVLDVFERALVRTDWPLEDD